MTTQFNVAEPSSGASRIQPRTRIIFAAITLTAVLTLSLPLLFWHQLMIPSGHMKPTLLVGEHVGVWRFFDPELQLQQGQVVAFSLTEDRVHYVHRVIGLPGDRVQMLGGVPHINGVAVGRERIADFVDDGSNAIGGTIPRFRETLPNGVSHEVLDDGSSIVDDTPEMTVPGGHVFVLGDHRDNATDSRLSSFGFVPIDRILGPVETGWMHGWGRFLPF